MQQNVDNAGCSIFGAIMGATIASQLMYQVGTGVLTAVAAYVAVHFTKMVLNKYTPLKKRQEGDGE